LDPEPRHRQKIAARFLRREELRSTSNPWQKPLLRNRGSITRCIY
jgi:hypothetical protein